MWKEVLTVPMLSRRVRLSSKGQLVIPQEVREQLGLHAGDELVLHLVTNRFLAVEVPEPSPLQKALAELDAEGDGTVITPADVERAINEVREEVRRERTARANAA